ncbi:MAG TPA: YfbM family protein [Candidatus Acidoferrum sp.]|nr:YfbM family protein [Candidatus Acidoferrum sp.]
MSIIAHLRQVSADQIKQFEKDPSTAYSFILGTALSNVRNTSQEIQAWKARNALTLLKVIQAGKLENLNTQDRLLFDKAHLELTNISRKAVLQGVASMPKRSLDAKTGLCLEKSWHGIHYLLTGVAKGGSPPLSWAVLGAKEIPDPEKLLAYGPARALTPKQVATVSRALSSFTEREFRRRFNPKEMEAAKIYAVRDDGDLEYLCDYFTKLKAYYLQAAKKHQGMLAHFD